MINLDDELTEEYLAACRENMAGIVTDLTALEENAVLEENAARIDEAGVNRILQALHSVRAKAASLDLMKIQDLAHKTEEVLAQVRARKMALTPGGVELLLRATDRLNQLIQSPAVSNQADIDELVAALGQLPLDHGAVPAWNSLRALLAEDDLASRLLLQSFLSRYGECHATVDGKEAVAKFEAALEQGRSYNLVCMDLMMPELDGREAVRQIRALEEAQGIFAPGGAKIIMTTAVSDIKEVIRCFESLCDAYLVKPIDLAQLLKQMRTYRLVQ